MAYESSHSEKSHGKSVEPYWGEVSEWSDVIPGPDDDIQFDDDCPPLESGFYANPVVRFKGRIIEERNSPLDPFDPEMLAFMQSLTPEVQMEPGILGGTPVFANTLVPIKRMFDYLLAGKTVDDFLRDYPSVPRDLAFSASENEAILFYEEISKAMDSAAMTA
ncbi:MULTISPECIES: DUF433 domain-containing protein [unclassified Duganella]|jgi:uncharacterized protein (DUF433 family)|uniref:DUF433 domain-containing protein n=1 Tax=unclassified Duganella TaxID=2636909 RepID=UPI001C31A012|nr:MULTISPECIES: DUF433 domain-containing protein [unclassified Duganella]